MVHQGGGEAVPAKADAGRLWCGRGGRVRVVVILVAWLCLGDWLGAGEGSQVRVGPVWRPGLSLSCRHGPGAGSVPLPAASGSGLDGAGLDSGTELGDRIFDDGYVLRDPGTGNPDSLAPDLTWNWGYASQAQFDPGSGMLRFSRAAESMAARHDFRRGPGVAEAEAGLSAIGVEVVRQWAVGVAAAGCLSFELGLSGMSAGSRIMNTRAPVLWQREQLVLNRYREIYFYDAGGLVLPGSYQGSYAGPFGEPPVLPSLLLPNVPAALERRPDGVVALGEAGVWEPVAFRRVRSRWEADTLELSAGPQLEWQPCPRWRIYAGVQLLLTCLQGSGDCREEVSWRAVGGGMESIRRRSRSDHRQLLAGIAVRSGTRLDLAGGFYLSAGGGWAAYADKADWRAGSARAVLDLDGMLFHLAVGKDF